MKSGIARINIAKCNTDPILLGHLVKKNRYNRATVILNSEANMHHVLPPEKYFHWRAGEITRLEAFCDVVFGFAITLLVVSLEVPRSFEELLNVMRGFLP